MKYGQPHTITIKIEVTRNPGIFLAKATSDDMPELEGEANSSNESERDLAYAMGNSVCNLLTAASQRYHKLHDVAGLMDLKPAAQKQYEQLTLVFAR